MEEMRLATGKKNVNPETGEVEPELVAFYPTHFKAEQDGCFYRVENPKVWVQKNCPPGYKKTNGATPK